MTVASILVIAVLVSTLAGMATAIVTLISSIKAVKVAAVAADVAHMDAAQTHEQLGEQKVVVDGIHVLVNSGLAKVQSDLRDAVARIVAMTAAQEAIGRSTSLREVLHNVQQLPDIPLALAQVVQEVSASVPTTGEKALKEEKEATQAT